MPETMTPEQHYAEAKRLLGSAVKFTGFPDEEVPPKLAARHDELVALAEVHAILAVAGSRLRPHNHHRWPARDMAVVAIALAVVAIIAQAFVLATS